MCPNGNNFGWYLSKRKVLWDLNARLNGMTESAKNDGSLCRITSTPTLRGQRQAKAKLFRVKNTA
jgi:hypothetical protein